MASAPPSPPRPPSPPDPWTFNEQHARALLISDDLDGLYSYLVQFFCEGERVPVSEAAASMRHPDIMLFMLNEIMLSHARASRFDEARNIFSRQIEPLQNSTSDRAPITFLRAEIPRIARTLDSLSAEAPLTESAKDIRNSLIIKKICDYICLNFPAGIGHDNSWLPSKLYAFAKIVRDDNNQPVKKKGKYKYYCLACGWNQGSGIGRLGPHLGIGGPCKCQKITQYIRDQIQNLSLAPNSGATVNQNEGGSTSQQLTTLGQPSSSSVFSLDNIRPRMQESRSRRLPGPFNVATSTTNVVSVSSGPLTVATGTTNVALVSSGPLTVATSTTNVIEVSVAPVAGTPNVTASPHVLRSDIHQIMERSSSLILPATPLLLGRDNSILRNVLTQEAPSLNSQQNLGLLNVTMRDANAPLVSATVPAVYAPSDNVTHVPPDSNNQVRTSNDASNLLLQQTSEYPSWWRAIQSAVDIPSSSRDPVPPVQTSVRDDARLLPTIVTSPAFTSRTPCLATIDGRAPQIFRRDVNQELHAMLRISPIDITPVVDLLDLIEEECHSVLTHPEPSRVPAAPICYLLGQIRKIIDEMHMKVTDDIVQRIIPAMMMQHVKLINRAIKDLEKLCVQTMVAAVVDAAQQQHFQSMQQPNVSSTQDSGVVPSHQQGFNLSSEQRVSQPQDPNQIDATIPDDLRAVFDVQNPLPRGDGLVIDPEFDVSYYPLDLVWDNSLVPPANNGNR